MTSAEASSASRGRARQRFAHPPRTLQTRDFAGPESWLMMRNRDAAKAQPHDMLPTLRPSLGEGWRGALTV